jgi:SAM-dependent methyltransferase
MWAEFGAGEGTFTRALAHLLGPSSRIYAVDRDPAAVAALQRWAQRDSISVVALHADFARPFELPGVSRRELDGILVANALHFVPDPDVVLARLVAWLRPGGRAVIVEYDERRASRWVPYPISAARLADVVAASGLSKPTITATRPSAFGGTIYVAVAVTH